MTERRAKPRMKTAEIAAIASVGPSAVSNWRRRYDDFPDPVESPASGDLFDRNEVVQWLLQHKKIDEAAAPDLRQNDETRAWSLFDALPNEVSRSDLGKGIVPLLQAMVVRAASGQQGVPPDLVGAWEELATIRTDDEGSLQARWEEITSSVSRSEPYLGRALRGSPEQSAGAIRASVDAVAKLPDDSDWGDTASALLRIAAGVGEKRSAEFSSPESVAVLATELLQPITGAVYDPAAGAGMFLAKAWSQREGDGVQLYGQEINAESWQVGYLHLWLHGADLAYETGDALIDDRHFDLKADRVYADPPFSAGQHARRIPSGPRWQFGVPARRTDWLWVQHLLYHLSANGLGVMATVASVLSRGGTEESIRREIILSDRIDAVISLPSGMFHHTGVPVFLLLFAGEREVRTGQILFVDGSRLGTARRGGTTELPEVDRRRIVDTVNSWRDGSFHPTLKFSASVPVQTVAEGEASLLPSRYIKYITTGIQGENAELPGRVSKRGDRLTEAADRLSELGQRLKRRVEALRLRTESSSGMSVKLRDLLRSDPVRGTRQVEEGPVQDSIPYIEPEAVRSSHGWIGERPSSETKSPAEDRTVGASELLVIVRGLSESGAACAILDIGDQVAFSPSVLGLRPNEDVVDPRYLMMVMNSRSVRGGLLALASGMTVPSIRPSALMDLELVLPDRAMQQELADAMTKLWQDIEAVRDTLSQARAYQADLWESMCAGLLEVGPE